MSSSGPENRFIQSLHRHLPAGVYRMKNHNAYTGGVPDCWYSGNQGDLWVEYKFLTLPKRSSSIVYLCDEKRPILSTLQQEWLKGRHNEGRSVGVIIGTPDGGIYLPGVTWQHQRNVEECRSMLLPRPTLALMIADIVQRPP